MELKHAGNVSIPVLGLGTWGLGGKWEAELKGKSKFIESVRYAIQLGLIHIDTAEIYAKGFTEELIGESIKIFDRKKLFLTSKVSNNNLTRVGIINSAKSSLKRLKTNYLDLYLVHSPSENMNLREVMETLEELINLGDVRTIGLSNFSLNQIIEAEKYLKSVKITAIQDEYNLFKRREEILDYCIKKNYIFIAYRPLIKGEIKNHKISVLNDLKNKYGKSVAQIALNWLVSKKQLVAIPKAEKSEHLLEISEAIGWEISPSDLKLLDNLQHERI